MLSMQWQSSQLMCPMQVICKKGRFGAWRLEQVGQEQRQDPSPQASQSVDDPLRSGDDPSWGGALSAKALNKYAKSQRNVGRRKAPVQQDTADMYLNQRESLLFSGAAAGFGISCSWAAGVLREAASQAGRRRDLMHGVHRVTVSCEMASPRHGSDSRRLVLGALQPTHLQQLLRDDLCPCSMAVRVSLWYAFWTVTSCGCSLHSSPRGPAAARDSWAVM